MKTNIEPIHLSLRDAAESAGISLEKLRQHIERGDLVRVYIDSKPMIRVKDLDAWSDRLPTERAS